jgi:hypothetical protein
MVNAMPRRLYLRERPGPIVLEGGWAQGPVRTLLKNTIEKMTLYSLRRSCKDNIKMVVRLSQNGVIFQKIQIFVKNGS